MPPAVPSGRVFFLPLILILAGCGIFPFAGSPGRDEENAEIFIAAEWNAQALFDGEETGNEYAEYLEAAGWTAEKYAARITALSEAVSRMSETEFPAGGEGSPPVSAGVPGLIGFAEIENEKVLSDLAGGGLSKLGFFWSAFTKIPGTALGVGFLSRFPLAEAKAHSITVEGENAPRPVLEVRVDARGKPLVFLLCHWKSKLGGDRATEAKRRASARVIIGRLKKIRETETGTPVIVMGDLNENHDEFYRCSASIPSALLPDDPEAAALAARFGITEEFLIVSGEKPPRARSFPAGSFAFYSPWNEEMSGGSYFYRDEWETIDHFLLSEELFDNAGWEFESCRVLDYAPFTAANGNPNSYIPRTGRGLSDHLPLLLYLKFY